MTQGEAYGKQTNQKDLQHKLDHAFDFCRLDIYFYLSFVFIRLYRRAKSDIKKLRRFYSDILCLSVCFCRLGFDAGVLSYPPAQHRA